MAERPFQFRNVEQLARCVRSNLYKIPPDVDLIIGVPRSGLLPAVLIANHLNLPHITLSDFLAGRSTSAGRRLAHGTAEGSTFSKGLVVDDSVATGAENTRIRELLKTRPPGGEVLLAAVYVVPGREHLVDVYFESVPGPRMFEWNMMNHSWLPSACVDIDGVLCRDPTPAENDDGPAYRRFLQTAEPLLRPGAEIGWLVTSRLTKYRALTEAWLAEKGIRYRELRMLDLPSQEERIRRRAHASFKAEVYDTTPSKVFIESSDAQAHEIARRTGKPVVSVESSTLFSPEPHQVWTGKVRRLRWAIPRRLARLLRSGG